ncbi:hypothetical protein EVAR_28060_1 [Eumeta japonica]|uniref:Uncharacterized protein n=1 Tax=Eumeta variegata TaxID=151549 RepID=A0A4C1W5Y4_EUMVA|nr:hypothetical protein EVAR_28060_1 [Eumeta japonica]
MSSIFTNSLWCLEFAAFAIVLIAFFCLILFIASLNYITYSARYDMLQKCIASTLVIFQMWRLGFVCVSNSKWCKTRNYYPVLYVTGWRLLREPACGDVSYSSRLCSSSLDLKLFDPSEILSHRRFAYIVVRSLSR